VKVGVKGHRQVGALARRDDAARQFCHSAVARSDQVADHQVGSAGVLHSEDMRYIPSPGDATKQARLKGPVSSSLFAHFAHGV